MKIAINGFGRIGRIFFRQIAYRSDFNIAAINDLGGKENLIYLLRRDSVYGKFDISDEEIGKIKFFQEKNPANLPWKELGIDVVVESTGVFDSYEKAKLHLDAGAKRVVITAPAKDEVTPVFTPNVCSFDISKSKITSNASCTTNAVNPVIAVLKNNPGIKKALLDTIHAYTSIQTIVDMPGVKNFRQGRAAAMNIVPWSTGAAEATVRAIPEMENKFDGVAMRVPVVSGSIADITFLSKRKTSVEEINRILKEASQKPEWKGILNVSQDLIVSTDVLREECGALIDLTLTKVVDGDLVKVFSWYDNEWGYCAMLIKHIEMLKNYLK
jgi:glyceraldehyde 3-phosphate dehydrogenase